MKKKNANEEKKPMKKKLANEETKRK